MPDETVSVSAASTRKIALTWHREWNMLLACMLFPAITTGLFVTCFPLWVVPWVNDFGVARGTVMTAFAVGSLVMGLASPLVGKVLDKLQPRTVVALGGLLLATGFLLAALAQSITQIIILYATLMALGCTFAGGLVAQSVSIRLFPHKAGMMGGLMILSMSIGSAIMPALLTWPLSTLGWRTTFFIAAAISLFAVVPLGWFLTTSTNDNRSQIQSAIIAEQPVFTPAELLRKLAFWLPIIGIIPIMFLMATVQPNLVAIAADHGISTAVAGYFVSIMAAGSALGSIAIGWIADRIDYRAVYAAIALALLSAIAVLAGDFGSIAFAAAFALIGFAGGGAMPLLGVIVVRNFGAHAYAKIVGMMMPFMIVAVAGPVLAGWIRDTTGSYTKAFILCAVLLLISSGALLLFKIAPKEIDESAIKVV